MTKTKLSFNSLFTNLINNCFSYQEQLLVISISDSSPREKDNIWLVEFLGGFHQRFSSNQFKYSIR